MVFSIDNILITNCVSKDALQKLKKKIAKTETILAMKFNMEWYNGIDATTLLIQGVSIVKIQIRV